MTAIRSPSWTTSPSLTANSRSTPSLSATTGISIFIDSRITSVSPSSTASPVALTTFQTFATISARISSAMCPSSHCRRGYPTTTAWRPVADGSDLLREVLVGVGLEDQFGQLHLEPALELQRRRLGSAAAGHQRL